MTRNLIATQIRTIADKVCRENYGLLANEPQLTSRIGQALELEIERYNTLGYQVEVVTQDIPDRSAKSLESKIGADLYIGVSVSNGITSQSKGLLVQAKWDGPSFSSSSKLDAQRRKMLARSEASYVWVYGREGVQSISANRLPPSGHKRQMALSDLGTLFSNVLACTNGDPNIGLPPNLIGVGDKRLVREALDTMLRQIGTNQGVAVLVHR